MADTPTAIDCNVAPLSELSTPERATPIIPVEKLVRMSTPPSPRSARSDLRNVAIVAHVDHGKTTLVDKMLWQGGAFGEHQHVDERAMDSGDLEREKGITILAKNTAIHYAGPSADGKPMTINIIDTPGHADFGGEVERGLSMVDGIVLLVDASEGPLPQTRFVLRKALNADMPVVLVVNKTDRGDARIAEVVDETYELFMDLLDESHSQDALDFPVVYASAKAGRASLEMPANGEVPDSPDLEPLFRTILETIPAPVYSEGAPLQAHVTNLDASPFLGRLALVRVHEGTLKKNQTVAWMRTDGTTKNVKITELLITEGLERKTGESAGPGDIVAIAGIPDIMIGETLADAEKPGRAAAHQGRRARDLDDDRHQQLAARRPRADEAHQGHRPAGQGPAGQRAGRQRLAAGAPDRAPRHLGGAGARRAGAGDPRRADAP